ncbi:hypothetical protein [Prevotellamassilia timonensis]|uniref:hypothetical protein n=1 Tax=Prevotellamassilia timonensis TaxID=1852370 RepID=UPI0023F0E4F9|nr:hypothetical protein [Prevotellamassilia timonensis]MDD7440786.1 hypothetical protein [Prevotellamassilia timonensis]
MKKVIEGEVNVVRINYRLTVDEGFAEVTVSFGHGSGDWRLHASFVPLEQREFVDALDRVLPFEVIAKDGRGGCTIQGPIPEGMSRSQVLARIEDVFADTIVTG